LNHILETWFQVLYVFHFLCEDRLTIINVDTSNPHLYLLGSLVVFVIITLLDWLSGRSPRKATIVLKKKENTHKNYGKIVEAIN